MSGSPQVGADLRAARPTVPAHLRAARLTKRAAQHALFFIPLLLFPAFASAEVDFDRQIRPILSDKCFHCHGFDEADRKAGLRLDTFEGATADLGGYQAIVPGQPGESEAMLRILAEDPVDIMPPPESKLSLSPSEIDLIRRWIAQGAEFEPHWAFQPVAKPAIPPAAEPSTHPIDHFIRAPLASVDLQPNPPAAPHQQVRRLALDLTGLPPDPETVAAFVRDPSDEAWARLIDRYLDSPHFGERLAWPWLDAARYADSNGYQGDPERTMWPWRDWLVDQLNANKPFDQLTLELLAGDLIPGASRDQILGSGFNRNHAMNGEGGRIPEESRVENVFDRTETTATVWMGLTFTCARCHDHKYDPVSQKEYFELYAFFNQTSETGKRTAQPGQAPPVLDVTPPEQRARVDAAERERNDALRKMEGLEKRIQESFELTKQEKLDLDSALWFRDSRKNVWERLKTAFAERLPEYPAAIDTYREADRKFNRLKKDRVAVMVMDELPPGKRRETQILAVGNYAAPTGDVVSPGTPAILPPLMRPVSGFEPEASPREHDRLDLARWLVSPDHPLTARVTVNRIWQMLFGSGIVKTPEDFGFQGERPTHPELLDWLAATYVESGWDTKALLKSILTSQTYRQSAAVRPAHLELDPENKLLARSPRHRLPSWMLRDQALALSGLLEPTLGGPPVNPYQPEGVWAEATFGKKKYQPSTGKDIHRRTIYAFWRRIVGPTMLFDAAARLECEVVPIRTNTPLHALTTLNDVTYVEAARFLAAEALQAAPGHDPDSALRVAFQRATLRDPAPDEVSLLSARLSQLTAHYREHPEEAAALLQSGDAANPPGLPPAPHAALTAVSNLILNLDEVLTRP